MKNVIVYLGTNIPNYVILNYFYLSKTFPTEDFTVISNNQVVFEECRKKGINVWFCEPELLEKSGAETSESLDRNFRNGFWIYTATRFQAIAEFAKKYPNDSIMQIEADVLLLPNFPFATLRKIESELSYPISQESVGIASTLYFKNEKAAANFSKFVVSSYQLAPNTNDCEILGNYKNAHPERVLVLPANLPIKDCFNQSATEEVFRIMTQNSKEFDGIFDGASWGQFITGQDPRNTFGVRSYFKNRTHQATNCKVSSLTMNEFDEIIAEYNGIKKMIYSLHIHSKDDRLFNEGNLEVLRDLIGKLPRRTMVRFSLKIFVSESLKIIRIKTLRELIRKILSKFDIMMSKPIS